MGFSNTPAPHSPLPPTPNIGGGAAASGAASVSWVSCLPPTAAADAAAAASDGCAATFSDGACCCCCCCCCCPVLLPPTPPPPTSTSVSPLNYFFCYEIYLLYYSISAAPPACVARTLALAWCYLTLLVYATVRYQCMRP